MPLTGFDERLLQTLTRAVSALREAEVPFAVGGGCAVYARGGPPSEHDVDLLMKRSDVDTAVAALAAAGMRHTPPPEDWLTKVYDGDLLVDLIFRPNQREVTDKMLRRTEQLPIGPATAPVLTGTDLIVHKLLVLGPHNCDFTPLLPVARALREQVDWGQVGIETADSPYAHAFLTLLRELRVYENTSALIEDAP